MDPLDNPVWHALRGPHHAFAIDAGRACRYEPEVSPFAGVPDEPDTADWDALRPLVGTTGAVVVRRHRVEADELGARSFELSSLQMVSTTRLDAHAPPEGIAVSELKNSLAQAQAQAARDGVGGAEYWARYRADAQAAIEIFAASGTRVLFAGAPKSRSQEITGDFHGGRVNAMYAEIRASRPNSAMYQGAPAASTGRRTPSGSCRRSAPRSSIERA